MGSRRLIVDSINLGEGSDSAGPALFPFIPSRNACADQPNMESALSDMDLERIRLSHFKRMGMMDWIVAIGMIEYNITVLKRLILDTDLRIGIRSNGQIYRALARDLDHWISSGKTEIRCSLIDLICDHGDARLAWTLSGPEEDLELITAPAHTATH